MYIYMSYVCICSVRVCSVIIATNIFSSYSGTGKTNTLVSLLLSLVEGKQVVHATAATNQAICELAKRYMNKVDAQMDIRKVLLFGSSKRLFSTSNSDNALLSVHFDTRVERLKSSNNKIDQHQRNLRTFASEFKGLRRNGADNHADNKEELSREKFLTLLEEIYTIVEVISTLAPTRVNKVRSLFLENSVLYQNSFECLKNLASSAIRFDTWLLGEDERATDSDVDKNESDSIFNHIDNILQLLDTARIKASDVELKSFVLEEAKTIFSTVNVAGRQIFKSVQIDVMIVDEATQCVQAESAIVLRSQLRCLVLAGDDQQLPATVFSDLCVHNGYKESLFTRLLRLQYPHKLLNIQYRMHPEISAWPNQKFYDSNIQDGENVTSVLYQKSWHSSLHPVMFLDVDAGDEGSTEFGSKYNDHEREVVQKLIGLIRNKICKKDEVAPSIGVISTYKAQATNLQCLSTKYPDVKVSTVDGFQGQECDIIIVTTVRSNVDGKVGFLSDYRRLNVALTRAKFCVIVVGNMRTIRNDSNWRDFISHVHISGGLLRSDSTDQMAMDLYKVGRTPPTMDSLERCTWKVEISDEFKSELKKLSHATMHAIIIAMKKICDGKWPKHERINKSVPLLLRDIVRLHKVSCLNILWTIVINQSSIPEQRIKLWSICEDKDLLRNIHHAERYIRTYTDQHRDKCRECCKDSDGVYVPKTWEVEPGLQWYITTRPKTCIEDSTDSSACTACTSLENSEDEEIDAIEVVVNRNVAVKDKNKNKNKNANKNVSRATTAGSKKKKK